MQAYRELTRRAATIYRLEHLQSIATWDRMVYMPAGSAAARAEAQAELDVLIQRMRSDPALDGLIASASGEALDGDDAANLALMRRARIAAAAVPEELTRRRVAAVGAATQSWGKARAANDWAAFVPDLETLLECVRERAARLGDALGLEPFDALLDEHDRGLTLSQVRAMFAPIAAWLPAMIERVTARQAGDTVIAPVGPFPIERQKQVGLAVMALLGFDFEAGRLDVSLHPFTGGTSEDVRITTRYSDQAFFRSLMGIVHEVGHGRYNAGLPAAWRGQPLGGFCSMSVHEGQSLSFERQLAPTAAFAAALSPLLADAFGDQPAFAPDNLLKLMTRVQPGKIRAEADEVTYPAHVLLRTEIEPLLIAGELAANDVPAWWDERMAALLGIDTAGDIAGGPLQDIHWSQALFGYFPSYLLGSMIAAQLAAAYRRTASDRDGLLGYPDWLRDNVWSQGARYTTAELMERTTGAPLSADALKAHFEARYL